MICHRCLLRQSRLSATAHTVYNSISPSHRSITRSFTQSTSFAAQSVTAQTTTATNPRPHDAAPAATSTSAAQPFSEASTPAPRNISDLPIHPEQTKQAATRAPSSVPAGTVLKGLNFLKNATDPVAKADDEYPPWLWTVLDSSASGSNAQGDGPGEGDLFSKSKKLRRRAAKALRRAAIAHPESLVPKVPLQAQSVDLPGGDGSVAGAHRAADARQALTAAMRGQRRKGIKEDNFLREMR